MYISINEADELLVTDTINACKCNWNLNDIYKNLNVAKESLEQVKKYDIKKFESYLYTCNIVDNEYSDFKETILSKTENLFFYFQLRHVVSTVDKEILKDLKETQSIYYRIMNIVENIEKDQLISKSITDNELINNLEELEEDINNKYYAILTEALTNTYIKIDGSKIQLNIKNYNNVLLYGNTMQRKKMYILYNKKIVNKILKDVLSLLTISVNNQNILNYLYRFKPKKIPSMDSCSENIYYKFKRITNKFLPTFKYYLKLKADYINKKPLYPYDFNLDLFGNNIEIPYCDAVNIIFESFNNFNVEYRDILDTIINKNWIDVYETENKIKGAYCFNSYETHPYILINYDNSFNELMVLSHEIGHAVNFCNANNNNNKKSSEIIELASEIPSILSELTVLNHLINVNYNNNTKLLELKKAEIIIYGIFKGMMQLEFIENIYNTKNNFLTESYISNVWKKLIYKYYGESYKMTEECLNDWIKIDLLMNNEKRFQYIMGYVCSIYVITQILPKHTNKYIDFLKTGSSRDIIKTFSLIDIDLLGTKYIEDALNEINNFISGL